MVKRTNRWFSLFLSAAVVLSGISLPTAAPAKNVEAAAVQEDEGREVNFNKGWKFCLGDISGAEARSYDDAQWENISIPHDFSINQEFSNQYEAESGFLPGGTGWYRKTVVFPASYEGKEIVLNFDGVYNNAYVYINGTKVGEHHYGYTDFSFDISSLITCDGNTENVIAVKAVNEFPSSRWYSGSGIYRDVKLIVTSPVHVALKGSYVTTPQLETQKDGDVTVHVETMVQNDGASEANVTVRTTVEDAKGNVVSKAAVESAEAIPSKGSSKVTQEPVVNQPKLWDCENPNLYYVKTDIVSDGKVIDSYTTEFGFRYIKYSADTGFSLNGKNVKMKGVCMHHDQGALGAAAYRDAIYRQVRILKEMGCNSIRSSHNAPSKILLDVCNELGMLVMDEVFDGWSYAKNGNTGDISAYFNRTLGEGNQLIGGTAEETWPQFALESFINRDKNDPCVVMWSIGNELPTVCNISTTDPTIVAEFTQNATHMISWIQAIDKTKPITCGDNSANFNNTSDFRTKIDELLVNAGGVAGLNYSPGNYANNHRWQPTWPMVATETVSALCSRGIYSTTGKISSPGRYLYTAYDTYAVSWGQTARVAWYPVILNDCISGTYVWTGFDYIGEPTDWNGTAAGSVSGDVKAIPNSSFFGIVDTAGFPKDSYYFYTSQWREDATTLHIVPNCWNEEDLNVTNEYVPVDIYSNAAEVKLYLNDVLIGTATRDTKQTAAGYEYAMYRTVTEDESACIARNTENDVAENMAAQFYVKYAKGTLRAEAYDASGKIITGTLGDCSVTTNSDDGSSLALTAEQTELQADGSSLAYISVDIFDKNGEFASQADDNIRFTLTGNGEIVGVDNGNQSTVDKFQQKSVLTSKKTANIDAFSGKALVIVRSTEEAGGFVLKAEATGMEAKSVSVETVGDKEGKAYLKDYDLQTYYNVDMGTIPDLQTTVKGRMSDESAMTGTVTWNDSGLETICDEPGDHEINGVMKYGDEELPVVSVLRINPIIVAAKNYAKAIVPGGIPYLPPESTVILKNGKTYGSYPVKWEDVPVSKLSKVGDSVTVKGIVTVSDDVKLDTSMTIRVAQFNQTEAQNVAKNAALAETCFPTSDNLLSITDGNTDGKENGNANAQKRWTNWNSAKLNSTPTVIFTWDDVQILNHADIYYYTDGSVQLPRGVTFAASADGVTYNPLQVTASEIDTANNNKATYDFGEVSAVSLRITFEPNGEYVGMTECEIYNTGIEILKKSTAVLEKLTVDGNTVAGFVPGELNEAGYTAKVGIAEDVVVNAVSKDNAAVSIVPPVEEKGHKVTRVLVEAEDESLTNIYKIIYEETDSRADEKLKDEAQAQVTTGEGRNQKEYTPETWSAYQNALKSVKDVLAKGDKAAKHELENALKQLAEAERNLKKVVVEQKPQLPESGVSYLSGNGFYKVTQSAQTGGTVTYVKPVKKTLKKINIPATVKISGVTFKVTAIAANACKNNKKLTSVTIGKNVKTIGNSAFAGDGKLKKIKINSTVLSKVGRKAFKGINAKAKIKVPKKCLKAYKKKLKGKGQKSSVKIQK